MTLTHIILALLMVLAWGINFVVSKVGVATTPPLFFATERFFLASIPLIFFIKKPPIHFNKIVRYGLTSFALPFSLLLSGMALGVSAGLASLLLQLQGPYTILLGMIFLGETPDIPQRIGLSLALIGLAVVGYHSGGAMSIPGFMCAAAAAAVLASGNIIFKRIGPVNMLNLVVWGSLIAWPPLLIASFIFEGYDAIMTSFTHVTWVSGVSALYLSYVSTIFGFGTWGYLLNRNKLSAVTPFTLLVPIVGFLASSIILGEPLQSWKILSLVLVGSGVAINIFGARFRFLARKPFV